MRRVVQPEILDGLPHDHPDSVAGRRDLRRLNFLMGTHRWLRGKVKKLCVRRESLRVLELGAGDGALALGLRGDLHGRVVWCGVDLAPRPAGWPQHWDWVQGSVLDDSITWPRADVGVVNLMLHHFDGTELRRVLMRLCGVCEYLLVCEPVRRGFHILQLALLRGWLLHPVTWHDGRVSIRAGFLPGELQALLPREWRCRESAGFRGTLRLVGWRGEGSGPR